MSKINKIYELFTTENVTTKARILLKENLGEFVHTKAWNDMISNSDDENIKLISMIALNMEAKKPGTVPKEMIDSIGAKIDIKDVEADTISDFTGDSINIGINVSSYINKMKGIRSAIAVSKLKRYMSKYGSNFGESNFTDMKNEISEDIKVYEELMK